MISDQFLDLINMGIVIMDKDLRVTHWNRWMALYSKISAQRIVGSPLFDFYPGLNNPFFVRNCKCVLTFGNFVFLSQKLHHYLFPFALTGPAGYPFEYMQQSCTLGPLRKDDDTIGYVFITVQDVTEIVNYQLKLQEMNIKDGLTGVYNRRFLDIRLREEFKRHRRYTTPLSLIMLDIDFFKKINDGYGHQFGDYVLQHVAGVCITRIRDVDILARYGGEEFCCLLPETDIEGGEVVAQRLRKTIEELDNTFDGKTVQVTVSLGVSELRVGVDSPDTLLRKADDALYEAKRSGRNKVVLMD